MIWTFYRAPGYLGSVADIELVTQSGRCFAETAASLRDVVIVAANDAPWMTVPDSEGVYLTGTGDAGIMASFIGVRAGLCRRNTGRRPGLSHPRAGMDAGRHLPADDGANGRRIMTRRNAALNRPQRTPQLYLRVVLCFNMTAGIGILGVAKTMMTDIFAAAPTQIVDDAFAAAPTQIVDDAFAAAPTQIVDDAFAANYAVMISVFNMGGRFFWASASDYRVGGGAVHLLHLFRTGQHPVPAHSVGGVAGQRQPASGMACSISTRRRC